MTPKKVIYSLPYDVGEGTMLEIEYESAQDDLTISQPGDSYIHVKGMVVIDWLEEALAEVRSHIITRRTDHNPETEEGE